MRLVMLGAPGAGKGTQAEALSKRYEIPTISTGEMIRNEMREETPIGLAVKSYMDNGQLIPDHMVIDMILRRLKEPDCQKGYILDGFPRTVPQAEAMERLGILIDYAMEISVPDVVIVTRMSGRRQCTHCGATYHVEYKKPKKEGICDLCGGPLEVRTDDEPHMVQTRLQVYHQQTEPLEAYFRGKNKLIVVKGKDEVEDTTAECLKALETPKDIKNALALGESL